jgi:hypothetical protein
MAEIAGVKPVNPGQGCFSIAAVLAKPPPPPGPWLEIALRAPLIFFAAVVLLLNLWLILARLWVPCPIDPWEAAIITDAWRMARGEVVYAATPDAPATHMYGPLITATLSWAYPFTGPINNLGRVLALLSAILLATILTAGLLPSHTALGLLLSVTLVFGINSRTVSYFAQTRPDLISLVLAVISIFLMYRGWHQQRMTLYGAGIVVLVVAFFFKQPAAAAAAVPVAALLIGGQDRLTARSVGLALLPLACVGVLVAAIKLGWPSLYYYMITVPSQFRVPPTRVLRNSVELLASVPLFTLVLVDWLVDREASLMRKPHMAWVTGALAVALPSSLVAFAKDASDVNSLLPALLAMAAFCISRIDRLERWLEDASVRWITRSLMSGVLGLCLFLQAFGSPARMLSRDSMQSRYGDAQYPAVIAAVKTLPGRVLCPEDPTILLRANGEATRSVFLEMDRVSSDRPYTKDYTKTPALNNEIHSADWIVQVRVEGLNLMTDERLQAEGFEPVPWPGGIQSQVYFLWKRSSR